MDDSETLKMKLNNSRKEATAVQLGPISQRIAQILCFFMFLCLIYADIWDTYTYTYFFSPISTHTLTELKQWLLWISKMLLFLSEHHYFSKKPLSLFESWYFFFNFIEAIASMSL